MNVDWSTLTQAKAKRLLGAAARNINRANEAFAAAKDDGWPEEQRLLAACELEENLKVFIATGEKPE